MAFIHTTRHELCSKRTSAFFTTTVRDRQRLRHCLRYLAGTKHHKFVIQPTVFLQPNNKEQLDLTVYTDADWAGCQVTRKSTSGFVIQFLGTTVHFGSRTTIRSSTFFSRKRVLRDWYRCYRGITPQELSWERSYTTRSASKYTLTAHQAKAWLHALACPSEPNTSSSNTCSYNTSFTTASFPYTKSTPNTIRQTFLQNTCNEKCSNGTYMLRAYVRQTIEENPATAVHTPAYEHNKCTRICSLLD